MTQKKEKKEEDWSFESNNKPAEKKESLLDNPTNKAISELKNIPGAISRLPNLLDDYHKASSGDFRTRKSDVSENWGKETEKALNKALGDGRIPTRNLKDSSLLAPLHDLSINKEFMEHDGNKGNDRFFHCKAAYESASRGKWGKKISKLLNLSREVGQHLFHDDIKDYSDDWEANSRGWKGAEKKKSLLESCSRNPRDYYK